LIGGIQGILAELNRVDLNYWIQVSGSGESISFALGISAPVPFHFCLARLMWQSHINPYSCQRMGMRCESDSKETVNNTHVGSGREELRPSSSSQEESRQGHLSESQKSLDWRWPGFSEGWLLGFLLWERGKFKAPDNMPGKPHSCWLWDAHFVPLSSSYRVCHSCASNIRVSIKS
jgi:hypothetical protein